MSEIGLYGSGIEVVVEQVRAANGPPLREYLSEIEEAVQGEVGVTDVSAEVPTDETLLQP